VNHEQASKVMLKDEIRAILQPRHTGAWPEVRDRLNVPIRGWSTYFSQGTRLMVHRAIDNVVTG
jgi:hypothetical protein